MKTRLDELLAEGPKAINVGVRDFAESLEAQDAEVIQVEWSPPVDDDQEMIDLLDKLL